MKLVNNIFLPLFLLFVLSFNVAVPSYAATVPEPDADVYASRFFTEKYATASAKGNGIVAFSYNVVATGTMDRLGATQITIYRQADSGSFTPVYAYNLSNKPNLMKSNVGSATSIVNYQGTVGKYYKAQITLHATKNGSSESTSIYTNVVKAT